MNKGEIWLANLPQWTGREQLGVRPVLVLSEQIINMVIIVPLTSNLNALKYPYTLKIFSSKQSGLDKDSAALLFQVKSIDKKRFLSKLGNLEQTNLSEIDNLLIKLLNLRK